MYDTRNRGGWELGKHPAACRGDSPRSPLGECLRQATRMPTAGYAIGSIQSGTALVFCLIPEVLNVNKKVVKIATIML
ncbi:MAG TPA: hypothetical protein IGS52_23845 [Oscillatoriaceae cyanobacterium M33_DOE_052]|uniref:Uncharacterized protein n=1 Tax=Planktothricoides sp. SpSt-374 TaxID=2282167 RepID=A0A7C3ZID2_9CYAN|nr:hypothetical protein [Oscillatoriaceae cyanobacterium M33_DOE_052]